MDCRYHFRQQVVGLRAGRYTSEVAVILIDHLKLLVDTGEITYGYLETTADELELLLASAKSKIVSVSRV